MILFCRCHTILILKMLLFVLQSLFDFIFYLFVYSILTQMVWFRENWYEEVLRQLKQGLAKCHAVAFENRGAGESSNLDEVGVLVMLIKGSVLHGEFLSFQWLMQPSPPTP